MDLKTHHIALTVNNLDESIKWYKEKLRFELIHRYKKDDMEFALLSFGKIRIELFNFKNQTLPLPEYRKELISDLHTVGIKHLSLQTDDLEKSISDLKAKGAEFVKEIDSAAFGGHYIFFKDLNGILI